MPMMFGRRVMSDGPAPILMDGVRQAPGASCLDSLGALVAT